MSLANSEWEPSPGSRSRSEEQPHSLAIRLRRVATERVSQAFNEVVQKPLTAAVSAVISAVGAALLDGVPQLVLAVVATLCVAGTGLIVAGARRRRRLAALLDLHAVELLERDAKLRKAQREKAYNSVPVDVANSLRYALVDPSVASRGVRHFVERNALRTMAEAMVAAIFDETGQRPKIEIGIVEQDGGQFVVTHASGRYTNVLKEESPCFAGGHSLAEVLAKKASAHFVRGGYRVVKFDDGINTRYLFALSSVTFGHAEKQAMARLALLVALIETALNSPGLES